MNYNASSVADKLQAYNKILRNSSLYRANALWTTWQSFNSNDNPLRSIPLPKRDAAKTINLFASATLHEAIMIAIRALDSAGRSTALKTNRVSFPVMVGLMKLDGVRDELVNRARNWFEDGFLADKNQLSVETAMSELERETSELADSDVAKRLRNFRDEFLAHNLAFDEERERPVFSDVTQILTDLRALSDKASLAFEGSEIGWDFADDEWSRSASDLWRTIYDGTSPNPNTQHN